MSDVPIKDDIPVKDAVQEPKPQKQNQQPGKKQLKIFALRPKDEFHPGGYILQIVDNDGTTIIKEWWESFAPVGVQYCRNWLKVRAGEELDYSHYEKKETDAKPDNVG